jgi:exodeoxyribonuclease V gamma subunit
VVVSELLEALGGGERLVVRHPLQPFSPAYFRTDDRRLFSYSRTSWEGATALVGERVEAAPFFGEQALDAVDGSELVVDDLLRYFRHPTRFLLQRRVGLYLADEGDAVDDREPVTLGPLERYSLGSSLLGRALEHGDLADAFPSVRAAGGLPLGAAGACAFADMVPEVETLGSEAASWMQGDPPDPVAVDVTVGGTRLGGTLPGVWPGAQLVHGYGKLDARRLLDIWIRHLVLLSLEDDDLPSTSVLVARPERAGGPSSVSLGRLEGAGELLADLVEVYLAGQREPLPLFPAASLEYVDGWHRAGHLDDADRHAEAMRRASAAFHRRWGAPGDAADRYVVRAFGSADPLEAGEGDFARLSLRVFDPLLEGLEEEA